MQSILILNPKGGSGKSTLAVNLAGFYACWGGRVMIADFDAQATSLDWLNLRPESCPGINGVSGNSFIMHRNVFTDYVIMDAPSGCDRDAMLPWIKKADKVIIPVVPSPQDIWATRHLIDWIATDERLEKSVQSVGLVANRVRRNTRSFTLLKSFLETVPLPCVGILRDTQNYLFAAQHGLSIFELPTHRVKKDLKQWQNLIRWLCIDPYINYNVPIKPDQTVNEKIYENVL